MRSVAVLPISPSQRLVTVEVGSGAERRWLVLGVTASTHRHLHTMAPQDEALATPARTASPFAQLLGQAAGKRQVNASSSSPSPRWGEGRGWVPSRQPCCHARRRPRACPCSSARAPAAPSYSVPIQTLLFFTALSFLPAVLLMMTGFTRIVIVLASCARRSARRPRRPTR
jgi:hypothetical protein